MKILLSERQMVLMDGFAMPGADGDKSYLHDICLCNKDTGKIFYDDLELVNYVKNGDELESDLDMWLHVLRNLVAMNKLPFYLRKPIFEKLF